MSDRQTQRQAHLDRPVLGADIAAEDRPGVPMEQPKGKLTPTAPESIERMKPRRGIVHRKGAQLTPVFGTAQPLHGVSGLVRRIAYSTRETRMKHWMMLLLADRVDVMEHRAWKLTKLAAGAAAVLFVIRILRD
ncbi:MAG: hypothetical protein ABR567_23225 [Myxococcales bacterium]|nr:hypothetical protein [Myxococcales bacterium]